MSTIAKMNFAQLTRRRAILIAELEASEPVRMQELAAVDEALRNLSTPGGPYSGIRRLHTAVTMFLESTGDWQTKRQIADGLVAGGFSEGREMGPYLIRDSINYHVKKGHLIDMM